MRLRAGVGKVGGEGGNGEEGWARAQNQLYSGRYARTRSGPLSTHTRSFPGPCVTPLGVPGPCVTPTLDKRTKSRT